MRLHNGLPQSTIECTSQAIKMTLFLAYSFILKSSNNDAILPRASWSRILYTLQRGPHQKKNTGVGYLNKICEFISTGYLLSENQTSILLRAKTPSLPLQRTRTSLFIIVVAKYKYFTILISPFLILRVEKFADYQSIVIYDKRIKLNHSGYIPCDSWLCINYIVAQVL